MKKFLLAVATAFLSFSAVSAQETMWGITGGLNVSSFNGSDYKAKAGFNVGAKVEYEIANPFFVEASAVISDKGVKWKPENSLISALGFDDEAENKINMWYLHIPVNFGYKFNLNQSLAIAPKAGVFASLGLWGSDENDENPFTDYSEYAGLDDFNRFDFGFGLGANFWAAKHFEVSTGYEFGMVKAYKKDSNTRNWYLNIAFLF